jgi:hypothetical protein
MTFRIAAVQPIPTLAEGPELYDTFYPRPLREAAE